MFFIAARITAGRCLAAMLVLFAAGTLAAAPAGPTLQLDYGCGRPYSNAVSQFMYFVPLISPEPVSVFTNAGSTQCARVLSFRCQTSGATFLATCEFEFTGSGFERNVFDHARNIRNHQQELQAGVSLKHQLDSINVTGDGLGSVEIEGVITNGQRVVNRVQFCFNRNGCASPVTISLADLAYARGAVQKENEMVARVNALTFRRTGGAPKMEVSLASVKRKGAGDGLWQNFYGSLKGAALNLFLPPLNVEAAGHQTMLDFGFALAMEKPTFTFPPAERLQGSAPAEP